MTRKFLHRKKSSSLIVARSIALVIFLFSINAMSQTPNYFGNNPTWHCSFWNSDQWSASPEPYTDEYLYYLNGDTNALGFTYHRVFKKGYRNYDLTPPVQDLIFDEQTPYYVRQEARSIRFFTVSNNSDSLLVYYDYNVGDTVAGAIFLTCHSNDTIQKIDSLLINSEYRKIFYLDTLNGPVIIEGIGHQNSLSGSSGEFLEQLCYGIGFDYSIHCYGQSNIPLWDSEGNGGDCYLNVGLPKRAENYFTVSPNPASDYLEITLSEGLISEVAIIDLYGKIVLKTVDSKIDVSHLLPGGYILLFSDQNGNIGREKIVIF